MLIVVEHGNKVKWDLALNDQDSANESVDNKNAEAVVTGRNDIIRVINARFMTKKSFTFKSTQVLIISVETDGKRIIKYTVCAVISRYQ